TNARLFSRPCGLLLHSAVACAVFFHRLLAFHQGSLFLFETCFGPMTCLLGIIFCHRRSSIWVCRAPHGPAWNKSGNIVLSDQSQIGIGNATAWAFNSMAHRIALTVAAPERAG